MMKTPSEIMRICLGLRLLKRVCPARLPQTETGYDGYVGLVIRRGANGEVVDLSISHGTEHANPKEDAPPAFAHVVVEGGHLTHAFDTFTFPQNGTQERVRNGLLESGALAIASRARSPRALFLGRATWGHRSGTLALAPSFKYVDSIHAGHLIFCWREDKLQYDISLHAWEPFRQTVSTLRAVVESIRP